LLGTNAPPAPGRLSMPCWLLVVCLLGEPPVTPPADSQPVTAPASQPEAVATPENEARIRTILEAMEARGDSVQNLRCRVEYTVEDLIGLSDFTKFGEIRYRREKPNPTFFILFEKMHEGGIVVRKKEWYLFRDRWLYEAKEASQTVIEREVVREGETIDLFSLEKTPFPIPFGQRKDEILRHFQVALSATTPDDPGNTDHLVCIPRTGSKLAEQYTRLEFFVDRALHLPVKIVAYEADPVDRSGPPAKIMRAVFPDLTAHSINTADVEKTFQLPPDTQTFSRVKEPLPEPVAPAPPHD